MPVLNYSILNSIILSKDCSRKKRESDQQERRRKCAQSSSPGLREASFQNGNRKRRGDGNPDQIHAPQQSPLPSVSNVYM